MKFLSLAGGVLRRRKMSNALFNSLRGQRSVMWVTGRGESWDGPQAPGRSMCPHDAKHWPGQGISKGDGDGHALPHIAYQGGAETCDASAAAVANAGINDAR